MNGRFDIRSSVKSITPAYAAKLLEDVLSNTRVDQRILQAFERDMLAGRWMLNGAPIILDANGKLLDGRTRLLACVKSACSFNSLIVEGIHADTFETIDTIRKRTLADILSIRSEPHGRALAAALRIIWSSINGAIPGAGKIPSPIALLSLLEDRPLIRDSIRPALRASPLLPHGCGIALHYLMSQASQREADRFITLLGEPISIDHIGPVIQLRNALLGLKGQGGNRKQAYVIAITIKAWNAYRANRPLKLLKYDPDRESFPRIEGELDWGPLSKSLNKIDKINSLPHCDTKPNTVRAKAIRITPDMAESILNNRGVNRKISAPVMNKYARDMKEGRWHLNGQTIKISSSGRLLDGQHRLEAAKKAKCSFPAIIVEGLSEDIFSSLDIGHRRSMSDVLREKNESHTIVLASAIRWLWMIQNNVVLAANSSPTNGEMIHLLEQHPDIRKSLKQVMTIRQIMGSGIAAALHYLFSVKNREKADLFFSRLIDGVQLTGSSPIYLLRERLIRTRASHRVRLAEAERVALSIKAWNAFISDREMQMLSWRNRGSNREPLPNLS